MQYVNLASTDLRISRMGVGCYAAAGVYGDFDADSFGRLLRFAHEQGVTLFDTAPTYGEGEQILGRAVRPFRDDAVLATKVGLTPAGDRDASPDNIIRSCERSLRRLGTDYIDLYMVHFDDPETPVSETVRALESLQKEGKIREYGVGHLPPDRIREYLRCGSPVAFLTELNCVTRTGYQKLRPVLGDSVGIIGFSPTARGLLSGRVDERTAFPADDLRRMDPLCRGGRFRSVLRVVKVLRALAREVGCAPVQLAVRWAVERPGVSAVLTGTTSPRHLRENLGALDIRWDDDLSRRLEDALDREETRFAQQLPEEVRGILRDPDPDPVEALCDLVYVMEHAVDAGWAGEEEILPLFVRVWSMRKSGPDEAAMEEVRRSLRTLLSSD